MNFIHFPLCICNYFCIAGIVVETHCTLLIVQEMFVFLLHECMDFLLSVPFLLIPIQLLQQSNDLVLDPQYRRITTLSGIFHLVPEFWWNNHLLLIVFGLQRISFNSPSLSLQISNLF